MTEEQAATNGEVKDFGSIIEEEGPSFSLGGETFRTKKSIAPKVILDITEDGGLENIVAFVSGAVVKEDRQQFLDLVNDLDAPVTTQMLADVSNWLVELHSNNRPTSA